MALAAAALALHLAASIPMQVAPAPAANPPPATPVVEPQPESTTSSKPLWSSSEAEAKPPRFEFHGAAMLTLGTPLAPGLVLRGRVRLVAGLWLHAGAAARGGSIPFEVAGADDPVKAGVRELPLELGLGYRLPLGDRFSVGLRAEALLMSRRMTIARTEPQHRWLAGLRGGLEIRVTIHEQLGMVLLGGVEARLGRTEATYGASRQVFTPVAPYFELGPSIYF